MNNPDRARALLALADRVCAEEPTIGLAADLFNAGLPVECLTSLDQAAGAMPEGWRIWEIQQDASGFDVALFQPSRNPWIARVRAPDEPRARSAAALRAMAAEVGNG
jgi:hypothetical protein